ncbi:MAG: hypothetical protein ACI837_003564, partial [Crocinitomicaceae bacterium]
ANVHTFSSNSGGSWFSSMLLFSNSFVSDIQNPNASRTWENTGWLGQQKALFDNAGCDRHTGDTFIACVFYEYGSIFHWDEVVEKLVFKNYPLGGALMNGTRTPWAKSKNLLLAGSMLTTQVVLNKYGEDDDEIYYEACLSPSKAVLGGNEWLTCTTPHTADVTPVTFSSVPLNPLFKAPPFLPAIGIGAGSGRLNLGYSQAWLTGTPPVDTTSVANPLINDDVSLIKAVSASSAAGGFAASYTFFNDWEKSYEASDEAVSFSLAQNKVKYTDAAEIDQQALTAGKFVRIADGGPVDNSGVAQLVGFLQMNRKGKNFNIVAFDNVQEIFSTEDIVDPIAPVGIDIANLFGEGVCSTGFCDTDTCKGHCVRIPMVQIFDKSAILGTPITWSISTEDPTQDQSLIYTRYRVTTIDNSNYGIRAGATGILHAFTCVWSNADTTPENTTLNGDFDAYTEMLKFIYNGMRHNNNEGLNHLQRALGLTP